MKPTKTQPWIIILSIFLYRWIVRLNPQEFWQEYGEEILQTFRHCCHDAYKHKGLYGVLQLWPRAFARAIIDIGAEHATKTEKKHNVTKTEKKHIPIIIYIFGLIITLTVLLILIWGSTQF